MNLLAVEFKNKVIARLVMLLVLFLGISFKLLAQNSVLIDIDKGSRKVWLKLETDRIGLELDSGLVEGLVHSISNEGVVMEGSPKLYPWSKIKFLHVPNRYQGKVGKQVYWSVVSSAVFLGFATDFYMINRDLYGYIPLSYLSLITAPVWAVVAPVLIEVLDGPSNQIQVEIEGEVKVEPYSRKKRYKVGGRKG